MRALIIVLFLGIAGCDGGIGFPESPTVYATMTVSGPIPSGRVELEMSALTDACPSDFTVEDLDGLAETASSETIEYGTFKTIYPDQVEGGSSFQRFAVQTADSGRSFECIVIRSEYIAEVGGANGPARLLAVRNVRIEARYPSDGAVIEIDLGEASMID